MTNSYSAITQYRGNIMLFFECIQKEGLETSTN